MELEGKATLGTGSNMEKETGGETTKMATYRIGKLCFIRKMKCYTAIKEQIVTTPNDIDKAHKHNIEQKTLDPKEYTIWCVITIT